MMHVVALLVAFVILVIILWPAESAAIHHYVIHDSERIKELENACRTAEFDIQAVLRRNESAVVRNVQVEQYANRALSALRAPNGGDSWLDE